MPIELLSDVLNPLGSDIAKWNKTYSSTRQWHQNHWNPNRKHLLLKLLRLRT